MTRPVVARSLALLLALGGAGCGTSSAPSAPTPRPPEAERYQALQAASEGAGPSSSELYRAAMTDPNEFLRGMALQALAQRRPAEQPPEGFRVELRRVTREDPDLNRRSAAILLLQLEGAAALEEVADVYAGTENPETAFEVAAAAAEWLPEAALVAHWQDERTSVRHLVHEAIRQRTRRRDGKFVRAKPR